MKLRIKEDPIWKYSRWRVQKLERIWLGFVREWVDVKSFETFDEALSFAESLKNAVTYEVPE